MKDKNAVQAEDNIETEKACNKALHLLSFRPRSKKEIADKLSQKGFAENIIPTVIKKLEEQNLLNDREFAKWWIKEKQYQQKAKIIIKKELQEKGIDKYLTEGLLEDSQDDYAAALSIFNKKLKKLANLSQDKALRKIYSLLGRRGFDYEIIQTIIKEFKKSNL